MNHLFAFLLIHQFFEGAICTSREDEDAKDWIVKKNLSSTSNMLKRSRDGWGCQR